MFSSGLKAQKACFTPSAIKGCAPFTVFIDASCANFDPTSVTPKYIYDKLNFPLIIVNDKQHTYTKPGVYSIYQYIGTSLYDTTIIITVVDSPDPIFTLKSCIGKSVDLIITDPVYDKFEINWGDGSLLDTVLPGSTTNHPYLTSDGNKTITVTGIFLPNAACATTTKSIYVYQSVIKPDFTELKVLNQHTSAGEIQLTYGVTTGQKYNIERRIIGSPNPPIVINSSPITFLTSGVQTYLDKNLNTQLNKYEYKIISFDDCNTSVSSDPICSIIIKAIPTPTPALNTVTWDTDVTPVANFNLTKNEILTTPTTATSFLDNTIICGSEYCYNTTALLNTVTLSGTAQKSISIDTCIIATSIPSAPLPKVTNLNSTMNGNVANVNWTSAGSGVTYNISQSTNGGAFTALSTQTGTQYSVAVPSLNATYCYQIGYTDLCNNIATKSLSTCPVILESTLTGTSIILNWSAYTGFENTGVQSYVLQKIDENNAVILETNVGSALTTSQTVILTDPYVNYRIKVIPNNPLYVPSFSNNTLFKFEAQVFVPDIFTPNGDNSNDNLIVKSKFINAYSISIYSRWGEVVYAGTDITEGWNGYSNFVYAPEGAYTYKIIATDVNNKEFTKTGTVTLAR